MSTSSILQHIMGSLPNSDWPTVITALRHDPIIWSSVQHIHQNALTQRSNLADWSPASLVLAGLHTPVSIEWLTAEPIQPLESGLRIQALRTYESFSQANISDLQQASDFLQPPSSSLQVPSFAQAGLLALALRERLRLTGSWSRLGAELHSRVPELSPFWNTSIAILYGFVPNPVAMLEALINPDSSEAEYRLGVHALLSNPLAPSTQLEHLQTLAQLEGSAKFSAQKWIIVTRQIAESHPELAQKFVNWLLGQGMLSTHLTSFDQLSTCQQAILKAEAHMLAGQHSLALQQIQQARASNLHVQAELETSWALIANQHNRFEFSGEIPSNQVTHALRKSAAILSQDSEDKSLLQETQNFLSEILLEAGDTEEISKWLETLAEDNSPLDSTKNHSPAIFLEAARLALQAGETDIHAKLLFKAFAALENPPNPHMQHALQHRLIPQSTLNEQRLAELAEMAQESNMQSLAVQAARLALSSKKFTADNLIRYGQILFDPKSPLEARQVFEMAVGMAPENLEARRHLCFVLETLEEWDISLPHRSHVVNRLQESKQINTSDLSALGVCALQIGQFYLALETGFHMLEIDPEDIQAHLLIAHAQEKLNNFTAALEAYSQVTRLSPSNSQAWLGIAELQINLGQPHNAVETLRAAAMAVPDSAEIHLKLGELLYSERSFTPATSALKKAYELSHLALECQTHTNQLYYRSAFLYGQTLTELGEISQARDVFEEAYLNAEIPESYASVIAYQYAKTLLLLGQTQKALEPLESALRSGNEDYQVQLDYAKALLTLHINPWAAVQALQRVLQAKPDSTESLAWLAVAQEASGNIPSAFSNYQKALETDLAQDTQWRARLSYGLGSTAAELGKQDLALAALQEAVQTDPTNPQYLRKLAEVFWAADLPTNAIETARTALRLDQDNPDMLAWYSDQVLLDLQHPDRDAIRSSHLEPLTVARENKTAPNSNENHAGSTETVNILRHAITLAPERADLYIRLARHEILSKDVSHAVDTLQTLLTFGSLSIATLLEGGQLADEAGQHRLATDLYRRAAQMAKETNAEQYHDVLLKLARVQVNAQNYHAALQSVQQLIAMSASDAEPYLIQAEIFQLLEQPQSVISSLESAIPEINPPAEKLKLYLHLVFTLINQGRLTEAYYHVTRGCEIIESNQTPPNDFTEHFYVVGAWLANNLLLFEQARGYLTRCSPLERVNQSDPISEPHQIELFLGAELSLDAGEEAIAAAYLETCTRFKPQYYRCMALQSRILIRQNEQKRAQQVFLEACKLIPQSASLRKQAPESNALGSIDPIVIAPDALISFSLAAADLLNWDKALDFARMAMQAIPMNPFFAFNLARLMVRRAEYQHLCVDAQVLTHAPGPEATAPESLAEFSRLIRSSEKLLRSARRTLEEKGISIPISTELSHWKSRGAIAFHPTQDAKSEAPRNMDQPPPATAPWIVSGDDAAAWLAYFRRYAAGSPELLAQALPAAVSAALQNYPLHPLVLIQAGLALSTIDVARSQEKLQLFDETLSESHHILGLFAKVILAQGYASANQPELAARLLKEPLENWPDEPHWHALAAAVQWAKTDPQDNTGLEDCFSHLEEAIRLDPTHLQSYLHLSEMVLESKLPNPSHLNKAIRLLERASRIFPQESDLWMALAQLYYRSDKPEDLDNAGQCAEQAILTAETSLTGATDIKPFLLRAEIALQQGMPEQALKYSETAQGYDPSSQDALLAQVRALEALNQPVNALHVLDKIIPFQKNPLPLALRRAELLAHSGDLSTACAQIQQLAVENASRPDVFALLAKTLLKAEDSQGAIQAARTALQLNSAGQDAVALSTYAQSEMHHLIGTLLNKTGQLDSAIFHLDQATKLSPSRSESYLELAQVYQKQRQYAKAQQVFQQAIAANPKDFRPFYQAGLALKDSKDYLKAEAMLRRAVELAPENVTIRRQLAAVVALNLVHNPRSVAIK